MPDFLTVPRGDLIRLIYDLIDENNALKSQIAELRAQVKKQGPSDTGKQIPVFVKPNVRKKKVRMERKKRVVNFARKKDKPTRKIFHSYDTCPDCGGILGKPSVAYSRQIIDVPLPKVEITEHVVFKRWCTNCKIRVYPKVDLKGITVGKQRFGINLTSLAATLNEEFRQPLNKIKSFLNLAYDLEVSEGGIVKLLQTTSKNGHHKYEEIKENLRKSEVVYADETGSRQDGVNGYQWSFSNDKYQLTLYHKRRNRFVVKEFVGEEESEDMFQGVLVSDFLGSYNEYSGFHQRCWVHLLRDITKLKDEIGNKHPPLNTWAKKVKNIYEEAKTWPGSDSNLPLGLQAEQRIKKEAYFKENLKKVCEPYITKNSPMSTLSARAITHLPELFTFVRFPGIDSHNNQAERALRHSVVKRKISGGTRSEKGSRTREVLASLFGTWRLQGLNPLEQTRLMLANLRVKECE